MIPTILTRDGRFFIKTKRNFFILGIISATIILDQVTKIIARKILAGQEPISYLKDLVVLQYSENTGAFLGLGSTLPEAVRSLIFSGLVSILLIWVAWTLFTEKEVSRSQTFCYSLIIGGGVGNLIDRISRGSVTDFLIMNAGGLHTGIFNFADVAVTAAAIIMIIDYFKTRKGT